MTANVQNRIRGAAAAAILCFALLLSSAAIFAQDERAQYPHFLLDSYFGVQVGDIHYAFSNAQLTPGLAAESVETPHLGVRAVLFGHEFNKYVSAQISYLRPAWWVEYQNVNGDEASHSVWINVAGLTVRPRVPLSSRLSAYAEGGLAVVTRKGFDFSGSTAVKNANYATALLGTGLQYRINSNWDLDAGWTFSPSNEGAEQPSTSFASVGVDYTMRRLPAEEVERNSNPEFVFRRNVIQAGYTTDALGYGVNTFFSKGALPIFWAADVQVAEGLSLDYERNVFHTRRFFSFDWGAAIGAWKSRINGETFSTASIFPVLRFTAVRTKSADLYFNYSLAGPTFISRPFIDGAATGSRFTFQDFMGVGAYLGRNKRLNAEIRISHFSNGNLFPQNPGITVPLSLYLGYAY